MALLTGLVLLCLPHAASANDVKAKIDNAKPATGTITGAGVDTYSFAMVGGTSFIATVSELGAHTEGFTPALTVKGPDGKVLESGAREFFFRAVAGINPLPGNWTVEVSRKDGGDKGGAYELSLLQVPVIEGKPLKAGQPHKGELTRGSIDVYTFNKTVEDTVKLWLDGGRGGFVPEFTVFGPSGEMIRTLPCPEDCDLDLQLMAPGGYVVLVWRSDVNDTKGSYNLRFDIGSMGPTGRYVSGSPVNNQMGEIPNGKAVSGTIKGAGTDTYTFKVAKSSAFIVTLSKKGVASPKFMPQMNVTGPPGSHPNGGGMSDLFAKKEDTEPREGDWKIEISQADAGNPAGTYELQLFQSRGAKGIPMKFGQKYNDSVTRGEMDIYTLSGTPDVLGRIRVAYDDKKGFMPELRVFGPDGKMIDASGCGDMNCYRDLKMTDYGDYTLVIMRFDQNDNKGDYTISIERTDGKPELPDFNTLAALRNNADEVMPETVRKLDRRAGFYMWNMFLTYGLDDFGLRDDKQGRATTQLALGDKAARDPKRSIPYWQKAAELGNADAVNRLGMVYSKYHNDRKYETAAWYIRILEQGKENEDITKANGALTGVGASLDLAVASKLYKEAAAKGDAVAQFNLAVLLELGIDKKPDYAAAAKFYAKAAEQGLSVAQHNLAELFAQGQGVKRDDAAAAKLYLQAAEAGYPHALFRLAEMAITGRGMAADAAKAKAWLKQAADGGHDGAKIELAILEGRTAEAGQILKKSAAAGDAAGLRKMVELYRKTGIPKADYDDVLEIYRAAAGKINPQAFAGLADLFAKQDPPDYFEAYFWHLLVLDSAASTPMPPDEKTALVKYATAEAGRIVKNLSPEQAATAKWRVDDRHPRPADAALKAAATVYLRGNKAYEAGRYADAMIFFLQSAQMGSPYGHLSVAHMFETGKHGFARDVDKAIGRYKQSIRAGLVQGATDIGKFYLYGLGVPRNVDTAIQWLEMDASRGHKPAVDLLGLIYLSESQGKKALALYEKAAARGVREAYAALGMIYLYGVGGVPEDKKKALKWYLRSADAGHPTGAVQAGAILKDSQPPDYFTALKLTSTFGDPVATNNSAYMVEHQLGVKGQRHIHGFKSPTAMELYKKAGEQCYGRALYNIGRLYDTGATAPHISATPIEKNPAIARKWMELAATYGSVAAAAWLNARDPESPAASVKVPPVEVTLPPPPCGSEKGHH